MVKLSILSHECQPNVCCAQQPIKGATQVLLEIINTNHLRSARPSQFFEEESSLSENKKINK